MKSKLTKLTIILFFILILLNKDIMYITIYKTTLIWFKNIVPNLLPMFIISSLIVSSNLIINICNILGRPFQYIFNINKYGVYVYILSLISGSPSNAKYIKDLRDNNLINKDEQDKLLTFTMNYNPILIISLLSLYLPLKISYKILITIILANFITGIIMRSKKDCFNNNTIHVKKTNISIIIKDTLDTLLMILGTLIFFNLIINLIPINIPILKNILNGILEITTSLSSLQYINISLNIKILLTLIYLSFGGLSIHTQIKSILPDTNYKILLKSRIVCIFVSLILWCLFII